jgi:hypothetical protein
MWNKKALGKCKENGTVSGSESYKFLVSLRSFNSFLLRCRRRLCGALARLNLALDPFFEFRLRLFEIVIGLQAQPEFWAGPQIAREAQRGLGRDRARAVLSKKQGTATGVASMELTCACCISHSGN